MDVNNFELQKIKYIDTLNNYRITNSFNYRGPEEDNESVEQHFKIIEISADKKCIKYDEYMYKNLDNMYFEQDEDDYSYSDIKSNLVKDYSNKVFFCTDIHGDLFSFLMSLTGNEDNTKNIARFKPNQPCFLYRDISIDPNNFNPDYFLYRNNKVGSAIIYEDISNFDTQSMLNLVPIANLEVNPEFAGTFVYGGDLIDRGNENESCFYTFEHLLLTNLISQNPKTIIYEIGNHEEIIISGNFNDILNDGFNCINGIKYSKKQKMINKDINDSKLTIDKKEEKEKAIKDNHNKLILKRKYYMQNAFRNLNKCKLFQLIYTENNNIFCHSVIKHNLIINTLDAIVEEIDSNILLNEYYLQSFINKDTIIYLKDNILIDQKLNTYEIELLVNVINIFAKFNFDFLLTPKNSLERKNLSKNFKENLYSKNYVSLLWEREISNNELKSINGVNMFIVGHDPQIDEVIRFKNQYFFVDTTTSEGYCEALKRKQSSRVNVLEIDSENNIYVLTSKIFRSNLNRIYEENFVFISSLKELISLQNGKDIPLITNPKNQNILKISKDAILSLEEEKKIFSDLNSSMKINFLDFLLKCDLKK